MVIRTPSATQPSNYTVPRPDALKSYLRHCGYLNTDIAKLFSVTEGRASAILGSDACPEKYREILRGLSVPENLLPSRSAEKPGPKPRRPQATA